ncbi:acetylcholine receptor subunit alpha-like isoform X3 [Neocloeon triangulifer]|uniref:acetylcholine receptor subunit alpha-like isoform X3 n=1 Tax=Neocloeon triangulifer TaxID=2078957 RepID=UPI00286EDECA|nr:acetylcholine receptor subunit alpha-like isoform X3 [Neocloeon triangulifer]
MIDAHLGECIGPGSKLLFGTHPSSSSARPSRRRHPIDRTSRRSRRVPEGQPVGLSGSPGPREGRSEGMYGKMRRASEWQKQPASAKRGQAARAWVCVPQPPPSVAPRTQRRHHQRHPLDGVFERRPVMGGWREVGVIAVLVAAVAVWPTAANPDAKRLYDDLLSNYNKLVRPVVNTSDVLRVCIKLKLSQLIDVNLKNQIMTTNLWVEQSWYDYKLQWDPREYGGVQMLHVPSDHIWRPDIVLYNNADGNFEVTLATKATLNHTGRVEWKPPAIYKSSCEIDVEYFPFDEQTCVLKFGSWTYDGFKVDLRHMDEKIGSNMVEVGVDLSEFYMSVEWDILEVPAVRNEKFYTCCDEPYLDITFNITMRRKTLFYTVNIIIPCMGISFLTVLTFYLPSDSGEKVTLSISILISLHVFFLLVVEIIPPTSLVVPLLGKYLIFAMILVSISICVTVVVLNVHFRSPQTHRMAPWVKRVFIHILPRLLVMRRPQYQFELLHRYNRVMLPQAYYPYQPTAPSEAPVPVEQPRPPSRAHSLKEELSSSPRVTAPLPPEFSASGSLRGSCQIHGPPPGSPPHVLTPPPLDSVMGPGVAADDAEDKSPVLNNPAFSHTNCPPEVHKTCFCVRFIAEHTRMLEESTKVKEDWKYVAMVLDRLFLWIFTLAVLVGTAGIILQAPTLYDDRVPIDKKFSEFATTTVRRII